MNFRRIFEERALDVHGRVLGREQLRLFSELAPWSIREEHAAVLIQRAEALLGATYEPLLATEYMMYRRCGNRSVFEQKFFARRQSLLTLAVAEWLEDRGRFTDAIADLVWLILEETTWVVPAHNPPKDGVPVPLPFAFRDPVTHIDLFSATTAADLALAYSMTEKKLDAVSPLICERVRYELDRRIVRPFLDPALQRGMWWTGERGERVNNWNPC